MSRKAIKRASRVREGGPTVLSVFTGSGGMDLGFAAAGFSVIGAVEKEAWACSTLHENHPDLTVFGPDLDGDITELDGKEIGKRIGIGRSKIDVIIGGPPCQPFSQASTQRFLKSDPRFKRRGFKDKSRGNLLFEFVRIVSELQPRVFVLENVPGIATIDGGKQLSAALNDLHALGYNTSSPTPLEAANYGVPQWRRRVIIWGSKRVKTPTAPPQTHGELADLFGVHGKPYNTVAHALVGMNDALPNHVTRDHKEESLERYRRLEFGERDQLGRADRLDPYKPSKTVIAGGMGGGGRSHLHPFIARTLSVRECARLQTFPDSYVFMGSTARQFTQVGNAVPPLLAEKVARHIMRMEFGIDSDVDCRLEQPLLKNAPLDQLAAQMLEEARQSKPEWLYLTHASRAKHEVPRQRHETRLG